MMLLLETGLLGALLAIDLFLFYVFWEVMLVPMYLMIGIWGHGRKIYATFKFVLFTMAGSLLMLVAILYLAGAARTQLGHLTFDLPDLYRMTLTPTEARWLFAGFAIAFAIKVPHVAGAHLAARRAYRSSHRRLRDARGRDAQDGHLWLSALRHSAIPRSRHRGHADLHGARRHRHRLRRAGRDGPAGPETASSPIPRSAISAS